MTSKPGLIRPICGCNLHLSDKIISKKFFSVKITYFHFFFCLAYFHLLNNFASDVRKIKVPCYSPSPYPFGCRGGFRKGIHCIGHVLVPGVSRM